MSFDLSSNNYSGLKLLAAPKLALKYSTLFLNAGCIFVLEHVYRTLLLALSARGQEYKIIYLVQTDKIFLALTKHVTASVEESIRSSNAGRLCLVY